MKTALLGFCTDPLAGKADVECKDDDAGVPPNEEDSNDQLHESSPECGRSGPGVNEPRALPGAKL